MQLHKLIGTNKSKKRVGRGGKRGTYSGRGGKGQTARAGHRIRPAIRDYLKQVPKSRGRHKHSFISVQENTVPVELGAIERAYRAGETVSPKTLNEKGVISSFGGRMPRVKILSGGALTKKLAISGCAVSESAKKAIEKAGGTVEKKKEKERAK